MNGIRNEAQVFKAFLSNYGAVSCSVEFPSGKKVIIDAKHPYYTADQDELRFLSSMRSLSIANPDAMEVLRWVFNPENLPHLAKNIMPGDRMIETWKWTPTDERVIANILKARGYDVKLIKDQTQDEFYEEKDTDKLISILQSRGYKVVSENNKLEECTKAELISMCEDKGIEVPKRPSNKQLIDLLKENTNA